VLATPAIGRKIKGDFASRFALAGDLLFVTATKAGKSAFKGTGDRSGFRQRMPAGSSAMPPGLVPAAVYRGFDGPQRSRSQAKSPYK
jgi:hypothetical protein